MQEPTCQVQIVDGLPHDAAVTVHDTCGRQFAILVDRAQLLDDPEGVMREVGEHMDATMRSYTRALRRVPGHIRADYAERVSGL